MFNTLANTIETTVAEVATSEVAAETVKLGFTTENMRESLLCMGAGMIGIFIVVGIIILSVTLLNKAGSGKKKD
jgi:hypothetical protein